ncbi:hypothetical protein V501_09841 [Pseudogymnoascus sp. VKM F-4519 (FW-2642)]|nr:hypothetical protein V501_09841 [Pseudogymnoascus sp. VKM F-4519 (FW-2642)]
MERDIAGHGSKPLMQKAQEEGIYASFMPTSMIVTRLDQGLTLPPKINPETFSDNGESHKESTSKEPATKYPTSEAHDHHLIDNLSQQNASKIGVDSTNETDQERTGKVYGPCQHIEPNSHHRHEKLTDGPSSFPTLGQRQRHQLGFCSSCQGPHHASELVTGSMEYHLATIQSADCQGSIDEELANQLQLAPINGNIPSIFPMGGRAMPRLRRPSQDTVPQVQKPNGSDVDLLCNRECIAVIDQPVSTKHLASRQTDDLPDGGIGDRGQELTVSMGSRVEMVPKLSLSESNCSTPDIGNMADGKATINVSASEQLQDEKSQDDRLQYEQPQDNTHTSCQVSLSLVEQGTQMASGVSCGVGSPKAEGVEASLYSPIYKSPKANASSQVNTTIAATIRNRPAPEHISAIHQHRSLSTLYSSQPQVLAWRSYIANAPLTSPGVRKIQQLILAAIDGEIELERNSGLDAQLDTIFDRILVDEQFREAVVAFSMSKLGMCCSSEKAESSLTMAGDDSVTANDASSSNQTSRLGGNATASKDSGPKFNIKTCTFEELKEEYITFKALAKKEHQRLSASDSKRTTLEEDIKALKEERNHWKKVSSSVAGATAVENKSIKWLCTPCGLLNDSWADLTEWAPGKAPKDAKPAPEEAGVPESNKSTWVQTKYCRRCGRHESIGLPKGCSIAEFNDEFDGLCKNIKSEVDGSGRGVPTSQNFDIQIVDYSPAAPAAQSPQVPCTNKNTANIQGQSNAGNSSAQYLPRVNGTVADQQRLPNINGAVPNQQHLANGTVVNQPYLANVNSRVANQQYLANANSTVATQHFPPNINGAVPNQQHLANANGTVATRHFPPNITGTAPNQQNIPNGKVKGKIAEQQHFPAGNGTIGGQQYHPASNGIVKGQQYSPSGNSTISGQRGPPNGSGTVTNQQGLTGTNEGQNYLPSTNGSVAGQQLSSNATGTNAGQELETTSYGIIADPVDVIDAFTSQFGGADLFDNFDFDAVTDFPFDSEDPFSMADWNPVPSSNTGVMTSAASVTPNAWSPGQTTLPSASATPSSRGDSLQCPITIDDDDVPPISQEDMKVIDNLCINQPATNSPAKPKSKAQHRVTKPGVKYDMRGNQIGPSTLPTFKYYKPMAPRTAKVGALMFPTSAAAPKDAAPQGSQHPNGG